MNIDVVNKQVSEECGIKEKDVALINAFFWQRIRKHIQSYNPQPINIENLFVIYPDQWLLKGAIRQYIGRLRSLGTTKKFIIGSVKHTNYTENLRIVLRNFLKLRKHYKFTN